MDLIYGAIGVEVLLRRVLTDQTATNILSACRALEWLEPRASLACSAFVSSNTYYCRLSSSL